MTQSIPSSFNMDDLASLLELKQEEQIHREEAQALRDIVDAQDYSPENMQRLAEGVEASMNEMSTGPLLPKVVAMQILSRLQIWHNEIGCNRYAEDGLETGADSWIRDSGKLQACMQILASIDLGEDDFIARG